MKIKINDECGSSLIAVLKMDGTPAIEDVDFAQWKGEYHKNGKWSFEEGGVALHDGIVIVNRRSTHSASNNKKIAWVVRANMAEEVWLGRVSDWPERPSLDDLPEPVRGAVLESILDYAESKKSGVKAETLARWSSMDKFS